MKSLVIFSSIHHGNTEKIANAIAVELKAKLMRAREVDRHQLKEYDLIGFGSGIYFWRHHQSLLSLVDGLHDMGKRKAFIFSTSGIVPPFHFYHRALRRKLRKKGFTIVGEFACPGLDTLGPLSRIGGIRKGRPGAKDLQDAARFARALAGGHP